MIPWFFRQKTLRDFPNLSNRKQDKVILELLKISEEQKRILGDRISNGKRSSKKASQLLKKGKVAKAAEMMRDFKLDLITSQPVLNSYVATSLKKQMHDVLAIEGFEFPDVLLELRDDIDFGLFAINAIEELDIILQAEIDPFSELGIDLEAED